MKVLIDKTQAARMLDVPANTLNLWVSKRFGPKPIWTNNILAFDKAEIEAFAEKLSLEDKNGANKASAKKKRT